MTETLQVSFRFRNGKDVTFTMPTSSPARDRVAAAE